MCHEPLTCALVELRQIGKTPSGSNRIRLLLDSRVVDVPMAYNPTFVRVSSLNPFFFNSLKNELCFSDNAGA